MLSLKIKILHENTNENGRLLINLAISKNMQTKSTTYQYKNVYKGT